jgi:hypothetical protein
MCIEQRISEAKVSPSECISAIEIEWNRIANLTQSSTTGSSAYCKILKDVFACQEAKRDFLLAWFAEFHDNIVENLLSKDNLTYYKAKERTLNLPSNHYSPCRASSKNFKPQYEANAVSSSNGKKDQQKKNGSFSSSNSSSKECNWYRKHSPGTADWSYIDTAYTASSMERSKWYHNSDSHPESR